MRPAQRHRVVAAEVPGPWGPIQVAASDRGVVAIDLLAPREVFEAEILRRFGAAPDWAASSQALAEHSTDLDSCDRQVAAAVRAVRAFFVGDAGVVAALDVDLGDRPAWDRAVLDAVRAIPPGQTSSYGAIAAAIGRRGAARAVGGAVGRNPVSLAIPCHRVIAGDGTLGGYGGGWWGSRELRLGIKRDLLAREGTIIGDSPGVAQATPGGHRRR